MRKNTLLLSILFVGLLFLTACSSAGQASSTSGGDLNLGESPAAIPDPETPLAMQLALGTFKLDETENPIDAEQAATLLPLWKAARSLSQSETVATEELQAVINQVEEAMTSDQLRAILAMNLTFEDMGAIAEELGLEFGPGRFNDLSPEMQATMQAARESGQLPPGGFGPGGDFPGGGPGGGLGAGGGGGPGGGFGQGEGLSPEVRQTAIAERGGFRQVDLGVPSLLLDSLIEFLENKAK